MVRPGLRAVLCAVTGLVVGGVLGPLFVPDPTGTLAAVLTVVSAVVVGTVCYRSDWLRG